MNKTVLKARYGSELRKNWIHHNNDMGLNDLVTKMQRYFDIADNTASAMKLKYRDEENDWITLTNDDDLFFALTSMDLLFVDVLMDAGDIEKDANEKQQSQQQPVSVQAMQQQPTPPTSQPAQPTPPVSQIPQPTPTSNFMGSPTSQQVQMQPTPISNFMGSRPTSQPLQPTPPVSQIAHPPPTSNFMGGQMSQPPQPAPPVTQIAHPPPTSNFMGNVPPPMGGQPPPWVQPAGPPGAPPQQQQWDQQGGYGGGGYGDIQGQYGQKAPAQWTAPGGTNGTIGGSQYPAGGAANAMGGDYTGVPGATWGGNAQQQGVPPPPPISSIVGSTMSANPFSRQQRM